MLERLRHFENCQKTSGKQMSMKQKLVLYMGSQRRSVRGAASLIRLIARDNPTVREKCWEACRLIDEIEVMLNDEYTRDRAALEKHVPSEEA